MGWPPSPLLRKARLKIAPLELPLVICSYSLNRIELNRKDVVQEPFRFRTWCTYIVQMHLSGSQPPPLPLLCPNGAPLVQTQSRSRQCMTTLHNVTSANAPTLALHCNARPTLCPQKRWEVYSHLQPFQHWICIESASLTFTKRMPRSTTRPCRMTFALRRTATSDHFSRYILPCWGCIPQTNTHDCVMVGKYRIVPYPKPWQIPSVPVLRSGSV